jgi:iron complex transport system substrate-binding protein
VERIVALKPDLVLVLTEGDDFLREMEATGIRALKLFPESYEKAVEEILLLGRVSGTSEAAQQLAASMRARARAVQERVQGAPRRRVLYEVDGADPARPYVAGGRGFYGELLTLAGGKNLFADLKSPAGQVSLEQIVARDPEVILLGGSEIATYTEQSGLFAKRPGWSGITAVRARHVYQINGERITRPGPRLADALEEVARLLHPERF